MEIKPNLISSRVDFTDIKIISRGSFRIPSKTKISKTIEFFEDLYTYPPKFRVKWETIDDLNNDCFTSYKSNIPTNENHTTLDSLDILPEFVQPLETGLVQTTKYSLNSYLQGYINKITSTRFYGHQAKTLYDSLQNIPVYAILNGQGEIVTATSTDSLSSNSPHLNQVTYHTCGSFDPLIENNPQLGLFFLSKCDAEVYLTEIAKSDTQGTKVSGLSIHCFGLDFAYRVLREYHPNIDFRFIPNLEEVQSLLQPKNLENQNLLFEDSQQQSRLRKWNFNPLKLLRNLNPWHSPWPSILEKTEYFKGVPIFIVQVRENSANFFVDKYQSLFNFLDSSYKSFTKFVGLGFGYSYIRQGSIWEQDFRTGTDIKTYLFFEKDAALAFCKTYDRKIVRLSGTRSKILIHNFEDFIEMWEESLINSNNRSTLDVGSTTIFNSNNLMVIPSNSSVLEDANFNQIKKSPLSKVRTFVDFKWRRLSGFFETLLNAN